MNHLNIHAPIHEKLDYFLKKNKVPHIIFHGSSGTGKKTIVFQFLDKIYNNDFNKIKHNVMFVNCAHGKGIKFIRDELKFFAKTNIHLMSSTESGGGGGNGVAFKTIVLMNADFLTSDAQLALRRCIELFSYNTRFILIVENKNKLLLPILSRFCEIHVPEHTDENGKTVNLHQYHIISTAATAASRSQLLQTKMDEWKGGEPDAVKNINLSKELYHLGFSCLDVIAYLETTDLWEKEKVVEITMEFYKIKSEYRNEKLLILYVLQLLGLPPSNTSLFSVL